MFEAAVKAADTLLQGNILQKEGPKVDKADCSSLWTSSSSVEPKSTWYYIMWYLLQTMSWIVSIPWPLYDTDTRFTQSKLIIFSFFLILKASYEERKCKLGTKGNFKSAERKGNRICVLTYFLLSETKVKGQSPRNDTSVGFSGWYLSKNSARPDFCPSQDVLTSRSVESFLNTLLRSGIDLW